MKMVSKNILGVVGIFLMLIVLSNVSAAITIVAPATNSTNTGTAVFNVSYVNGTDFNTAVNATFYYNLSGSWTSIAVGICENGATASSCNITFDISGLIDGVYSINATLVNNTANSTLFGASVLTTNVTFDSTPPNVSGYLTSVNRGNYSGIIILNASVSDTTIGMGVVYLNITNTSGSQKNFTLASTSGSNYYNLTLNTSTFSDGVYNITAHANDTLNNLNNTEMVSITIDNTVPTATMSCTATSLTAGDSLTCSCSGSDATSGVASTTYTANPSTSDTGTYTQTCTVTDYSGNSATDSATYTISIVGSGDTGSGSGDSNPDTYYTKTIPKTSEEFSELEVITQELAKKERIKIKIDDETHYVGVRNLSSTKATIEIGSDPVFIELDVGEDAKVDVNDDEYYDVYVKLNSIVNGKVDLNIEYLYEEIPAVTLEGNQSSVETTGEVVGDDVETEEPNTWAWVLVIVLIGVVAVAGYWIIKRNWIQKNVKSVKKKRK